MNKKIKDPKILVSDVLEEFFRTSCLQKYYGTTDSGEIAGKILVDHLKERIKRGDFEHIHWKEDIYKIFLTLLPTPHNNC